MLSAIRYEFTTPEELEYKAKFDMSYKYCCFTQRNGYKYRPLLENETDSMHSVFNKKFGLHQFMKNKKKNKKNMQKMIEEKSLDELEESFFIDFLFLLKLFFLLLIPFRFPIPLKLFNIFLFILG